MYMYVYVYILYIYVLYDMYFECLSLSLLFSLFLNSVFQRANTLNFDEVQFVTFFFSFMIHPFDVIANKFHLTQAHDDFLLCFLLGVL